MNITKQRQELQRTIETLSVPHLMMVTDYITQLQSHELAKETPLASPNDALVKLIEIVRQTPFNPANVILPTKDINAELPDLTTLPTDSPISSTQWDKEWDKLEAQWKAERLAHETHEW